ncbi:MAG: PEP-CTERM sorting domain-containing protein [Phycisphaerales bacterium JB037]
MKQGIGLFGAAAVLCVGAGAAVAQPLWAFNQQGRGVYFEAIADSRNASPPGTIDTADNDASAPNFDPFDVRFTEAAQSEFALASVDLGQSSVLGDRKLEYASDITVTTAEDAPGAFSEVVAGSDFYAFAEVFPAGQETRLTGFVEITGDLGYAEVQVMVLGSDGFSFTASLDAAGRIDINEVFTLPDDEEFEFIANLIAESGGNSSGSVAAAFTLEPTPAPSGLAVLGLGALGAVRRRR